MYLLLLLLLLLDPCWLLSHSTGTTDAIAECQKQEDTPRKEVHGGASARKVLPVPLPISEKQNHLPTPTTTATSANN